MLEGEGKDKKRMVGRNQVNKRRRTKKEEEGEEDGPDRDVA